MDEGGTDGRRSEESVINNNKSQQSHSQHNYDHNEDEAGDDPLSVSPLSVSPPCYLHFLLSDECKCVTAVTVSPGLLTPSSLVPLSRHSRSRAPALTFLRSPDDTSGESLSQDQVLDEDTPLWS